MIEPKWKRILRLLFLPILCLIWLLGWFMYYAGKEKAESE